MPGYERKFFDNRDSLQEAYARLGTLAAVAEEFGVSKKLILNYMRRFGIARNPPRRATQEQILRFKRLAAQGFSSSEIASELGVTLTSVNRFAKAQGIEIINRYHRGHITTHSGYKMIHQPDHPDTDSKGYVREHRLIVEDFLGRYLDEGEVVHHLNGDKSDNRIENLELMTVADHVRLHHVGKKGRGKSKRS